jgi:hypothetical protein
MYSAEDRAGMLRFDKYSGYFRHGVGLRSFGKMLDAIIPVVLLEWMEREPQTFRPIERISSKPLLLVTTPSRNL